MNSFYSSEELKNLGLKSYGENVLISRKASLYMAREISLGSNVRIEDFCILRGPISAGSYVHIAASSILTANNKYQIILGDVVGIASGSILFTSTDDYSGPFLFGPFFPQEYTNKKGGDIIIRRFGLVGSRSIILPGVIIEEGTSVGAMSMVFRKTHPWTLYFGVPAKPIGTRDKNLEQVYENFLHSLSEK
jgi:acetyltransferase-like isoleucine patch superfamily enzyme